MALMCYKSTFGLQWCKGALDSGLRSCQPHQCLKPAIARLQAFSFVRALCADREYLAMSKAFTKETDGADDDELALPPLPAGGKNYITPEGYARLRDELLDLIDNERPKMVDVVHWAASNGDRSENGDYLYGKKRLREIDRRIRFLTKRLEIADRKSVV